MGFYAKRSSVILFLEEDEVLSDILHDLISLNFGENVIGLGASSVEEAKRLFCSYQPLIRAVMVDRGLKTERSEGEKFVHWLREEKQFSGLLAAFSDSYQDLNFLLSAGCNTAVHKPIKPSTFIELVGNHVAV